MSSDHDTTSQERLDALYAQHAARVLAYALRRTATAADAEDAASETFVVAWRRLDTVPEGDAALPWLLATCRRAIANQRRATARRLRLAERLRGLVSRQPAVGPDAGPALAALETLKDEDQELLRLVAWDDLPYEQIGTTLGISANAVGVRVHRARKRFRLAFERAGKDSGPFGHSPVEAPAQGPHGEKTT